MQANKFFIPLIIGLITITVFGIYLFNLQSQSVKNTPTSPTPIVREGDQTTTQQESANQQLENTGRETTSEQDGAQYLDYSPSAVASALAEDKTVVLFFHASWCPTCKAANSDILENISDLPNDLVIFKTDYDTQRELKQRYSITYQHTFVQIDENQDAVVTWNGGGVSEINSRLR